MKAFAIAAALLTLSAPALADKFKGTVQDSNGNTVGRWSGKASPSTRNFTSTYRLNDGRTGTISGRLGKGGHVQNNPDFGAKVNFNRGTAHGIGLGFSFSGKRVK